MDEVKLAEVRVQIKNPLAGVSFTPRKKPRFSDDSWKFPNLDMLPAIEEGVESEEAPDLGRFGDDS